MAERISPFDVLQKATVVPPVRTARPKPVGHDETPSLIIDHKFAPMGEWYTRCRYCKLAEAAHAHSEIQYYGDET